MFSRSQTGFFFLLLFSGFCTNSMNTLSIEKQSSGSGDEYKVNDECSMSKKTNTAKGVRSKCSVFETHYKLNDGNDIFARFGGKYTQELFGAARTSSLNDLVSDGVTNNRDILNDRKFFVRSTADFFIDFSYGSDGLSRIQFHDTLRFRHKWGGQSEIALDASDVTVAGSKVSSITGSLTKHILWTREAWIKIMLGTLEAQDDFIQVGLVPYSVGRGLSLGSAYKSGGFLGFAPGFSIDQFAPGAVLRYDLYPKRLFLEAYFALLENKHVSYRSNNESIRSSEILEGGASDKRGTSSFVYLCALRSKAVPLDKGDSKRLTIEPYYVYQQAPDQKIEFDNDSASYLKSFGVSAEFTWNRFKCGGEFGMNKGEQDIKPWDRNGIAIVNDDGSLIQQYTKIYKDDGSGAASTDLATVTTVNAAAVSAAARGTDYNSGEVTVDGTNVWNAADRFRPRQKKFFEGWFALFDASYDISPEHLTFVWGAGWVSGELSANKSVSNMSEKDLMSQVHSGFLPLQSVYSGTRLRHLVMINASIPRFAKQQPWETSTNQNVVTSIHGSESLSGMTNLSFIGGNLEWSVQSFKKHKLQLSPNVIHYWSPESPLLQDGTTASPSLGTELTLEVSAKIFDRIKLYSYGGVFFPGKQYTQMKEAGVTVNKVAIGDAPAYILNIGATFAF